MIGSQYCRSRVETLSCYFQQMGIEMCSNDPMTSSYLVNNSILLILNIDLQPRFTHSVPLRVILHFSGIDEQCHLTSIQLRDVSAGRNDPGDDRSKRFSFLGAR